MSLEIYFNIYLDSPPINGNNTRKKQQQVFQIDLVLIFHMKNHNYVQHLLHLHHLHLKQIVVQKAKFIITKLINIIYNNELFFFHFGMCACLFAIIQYPCVYIYLIDRKIKNKNIFSLLYIIKYKQTNIVYRLYIYIYVCVFSSFFLLLCECIFFSLFLWSCITHILDVKNIEYSPYISLQLYVNLS